MPFASPFGSISTPSFNPSYSNVPQNKPPKPAAVPETKPPQVSSIPETPESSVELLNAGIHPQVFASRGNATEEQQETAMPVAMPQVQTPMPMYAPAPFNPYAAYLSALQPPQLGVPARAVAPQLPQRLNPNRPIFV